MRRWKLVREGAGVLGAGMVVAIWVLMRHGPGSPTERAWGLYALRGEEVAQ